MLLFLFVFGLISTISMDFSIRFTTVTSFSCISPSSTLLSKIMSSSSSSKLMVVMGFFTVSSKSIVITDLFLAKDGFTVRNLFDRLWDLSTIGVQIPLALFFLLLFGTIGVLVFEVLRRSNPTRIESFFFVMVLFMSSCFKR